jgi:hypothetical protein
MDIFEVCPQNHAQYHKHCLILQQMLKKYFISFNTIFHMRILLQIIIILKNKIHSDILRKWH